jgi:hypothetical protein
MIMVKTSDDEVIKQFVMEHLNAINQELERCNAELTTQSLHCPPTLSVETIDISLRELVGVHQRHMSKKLKCQLAKFKACILDNELWQQLSSHQLTIDQVEDRKYLYPSIFFVC